MQGAGEAYLAEARGQGFGTRLEFVGISILECGGDTGGDVAGVVEGHAGAGQFLHAQAQPVVAQRCGHGGGAGDDAARFEPRGDLAAFAEFANGQDQGVRLGEIKVGSQKSHAALCQCPAQGFGVGDDGPGVFSAELVLNLNSTDRIELRFEWTSDSVGSEGVLTIDNDYVVVSQWQMPIQVLLGVLTVLMLMAWLAHRTWGQDSQRP